MLSNQPIKIEGVTTRGVVLIALLLSLFTFSGFDPRGPSREIQSVKTELVVKARRCPTRATFYAVAGQRSIFSFYPFSASEFLRYQGNLTQTKMAETAHQSLGVEKFFGRYHLRYSSLSVEEDIIKSLPG